MPTVLNDMSDIVDLIGGQLRQLIEAEEKRLLEEKELLQIVYQESTGTPFSSKSATDLTSLFATTFIDELVPALSSTVE